MTALFIHPPVWLALLLALGAATVAWSARWVTRTGAIATLITGALVFWLGGGEAVVPLIAFFVSSSVLTAIGRKTKKSAKRKPLIEADGRTGVQVLANGGAAVAIVIAHRVLAYQVPLEQDRIVQILFLAAVAAVNADTWATEIGSRWGGNPRQLSTWRKVAPGTNGAISIIGTIAAAGGALFIPLCSYRLWDMTNAEFAAVAWAGLSVAALFSTSFRRATYRAWQFRNPSSNEVTDSPETNGKRNALIRGLPWIDNNVVNFAASVAGALFCWVLLHYGLRRVM